MIGIRTKEALASWKAAGVVLGNRTNLAEASPLGCAAQAALADAFAANVIPMIKSLQGAGHTSLRSLAEALNSRQIRTARGGEWDAKQVSRVLARAA